MWKIDARENRFFQEEFLKIESTYVADGHHRSAAAYNVGKMRRARADPSKISGEEDFNFFMSILYPAKQLKIMEYNRVLRSLNGLTPQQFMERLTQAGISVEPCEAHQSIRKHECKLYLEGKWHLCIFGNHLIPQKDPVKSLDVQLLNDLVLEDILGITDVRKDKRIDFVGGIRGLLELEKRCREDYVAAFAMTPVVIDDLINVADAGLIMPPKSTWFEPKPRDGFVVRVFDE